MSKLLERNGNGGIDWSPWIRTLLTTLVSTIIVAMSAMFFMGERLETPAQKSARIESKLAPFMVKVNELERQHRDFEREIDRLEASYDDARVQGAALSAQMAVVNEAILEIRTDIKVLLQRSGE